MGVGERELSTGNGASRARRTAAILIVLAIFALRIDRQLLRLPFLDRRPIGEALALRADRQSAQYPRFLEGVRQHTQPGDTIAIVGPTVDWDGGYAYSYYRASYFLAGREVLPIVTSDQHLQPANFRRAKFVAAWGREVPLAHREVIWQGEGGVLTRR